MLWKLVSNPDFLRYASNFKNSASQKTEIVESGKKALVLLYGGYENQSLGYIRVEKFVKRSKLHSEFTEIEGYPPTSGSAAFHVQRIFLQVMNDMEWS